MTSFQDLFDRDDTTLALDPNWTPVDDADAASGEILATFATGTAVQELAAFYDTTKPTTKQQEVSAWVNCVTEDANSWASVFIGGKHSATFNDRVAGISARLYWKEDRVRTLEIRSEQNTAEPVVSTSINLVLAGGIEADGYEGALNVSGEVQVEQHLRLIVTTEDYGLRARAYVNELDDDKATLELRIPQDWIEPDATDTFGQWGFGLGPTPVAGDVLVMSIGGKDYNTTEDKQTIEYRDDQVTLGMLVNRVRRRYARTANTSLDEDLIKEYINDTVEEVLNDLGDMAWFMERRITSGWTANGSKTYLYTMPSDVRHVRDVVWSSGRGRRAWRFDHVDSNNNLVIWIAPSGGEENAGSVEIVYLARHRSMDADDDPCPIPREHNELIVLGACLRLAETGKSPAAEKSFAARYGMQRQKLMRDMNRYQGQSRWKLSVMGYRAPRSYVHHYYGRRVW